jgi:hypothetical protein
VTDWRLPEYRREVFLDSWEFHLMFGTLPGCVHHLLPAIAGHYELDDDGRAWLVWLNANTQNPAMSLLLLEASQCSPRLWFQAVDFWNENFALLDWDTDRRHQKGKFGEATEKWIHGYQLTWETAGMLGWETTWNMANSLPYMGRLSAWSMTEYARILFGPDVVPDANTLMLRDWSGSRSHRNGLGVVAGYEGAEYWEPTSYDIGGERVLADLTELGESLLEEMTARCSGKPYKPSRLDLESALCTYKGWFKPNRRYPNVYADMAYQRIKKAEARFGDRFQVLWDARAATLPDWARLECTPGDPGLVRRKQNHFRETGEVVMMGHVWPKYWSSFDEKVHPGGRPDYVCSCGGCWRCDGHVKDCTCDIDWDAIAEKSLAL